MRRVAVVLATVVLALVAPTAATAHDEPAPPRRTAPVVNRRIPPSIVTVTGVRVGRHKGFDRVVFDLRGEIPDYRVEYVRRIVEDGSGRRIPMAGRAFLQVTMGTTTAHDDSGRRTFSPTSQSPRFRAVKQVTLSGDFEATVSFGIGVGRRAGFRVVELRNPTRLVVDVAH